MEPNIGLLRSQPMFPVVRTERLSELQTDSHSGRITPIQWEESSAPFEVSGDAPILVAVGFSPASVSALKLSMALGKPLLVLHVIHDLGNSPGTYSRHDEKRDIVPMEQVAHGKFLYADFERCDEPEKDDVSMIVLGSHGRNGLSAYSCFCCKSGRAAHFSDTPRQIAGYSPRTFDKLLPHSHFPATGGFLGQAPG